MTHALTDNYNKQERIYLENLALVDRNSARLLDRIYSEMAQRGDANAHSYQKWRHDARSVGRVLAGEACVCRLYKRSVRGSHHITLHQIINHIRVLTFVSLVSPIDVSRDSLMPVLLIIDCVLCHFVDFDYVETKFETSWEKVWFNLRKFVILRQLLVRDVHVCRNERWNINTSRPAFLTYRNHIQDVLLRRWESLEMLLCSCGITLMMSHSFQLLMKRHFKFFQTTASFKSCLECNKTCEKHFLILDLMLFYVSSSFLHTFWSLWMNIHEYISSLINSLWVRLKLFVW